MVRPDAQGIALSYLRRKESIHMLFQRMTVRLTVPAALIGLAASVYPMLPSLRALAGRTVAAGSSSRVRDAISDRTAYVASYGPGMVAPIDTATNTAGNPIPAGDEPPAIAMPPDGKTIYAAHYLPGTVNPINTATRTAATAISAGSYHRADVIASHGAQAPTITSAARYRARYRIPFSFTVTATGNPAPSVRESGVLPRGVKFRARHDGAAKIFGTPRGRRKAYPITITATNKYGTARQLFTLTITNATWTLTAVPSPPGATTSVLGGVSCVSSRWCEATGDYVSGSTPEAMLAQQWNGSTWSIQTVPPIAGSPQALLQGVSCASTTFCEAVGNHIDAENNGLPAAAQWNGAQWTAQNAPNPVPNVNQLNAVACPTASWCVAVGYYDSETAARPTLPLVKVWDGSSWTTQTVPAPPAGGGDLEGVACSSQGTCEAVGQSFPSSGAATLAYGWNGSTWSLQTTPNPPGAAQPYAAFYQVSCSSATACSAVGFYDNASVVAVPFAEFWNGTSWKITSSGLPAGLQAVLYGVTCLSSTACTAVGDETAKSGAPTPLVEVWNGSSWSRESTPKPKTAAGGAVLISVSCKSRGGCAAIGNFTTSTGQRFAFSEFGPA